MIAAAAAILVPLVLFAGWQWLGVGYRHDSTRWSLLDVSDDGETLTIGFVGSSCDSLDRIERSESATTVRLTAVLRRGPLADHCDDGDGYVEEVGLDRPLAGRLLVDGHDGARPYVHGRPAPWSVVATPAAAPALNISYEGSSCDELNRITKRELPEVVEIKVVVYPSLDGGCVRPVARHHSVALGRPLGSRSLVDPRTGAPPPGFDGVAVP